MLEPTKIILTKENFNEYFVRYTGMGLFENPFNFDGETRIKLLNLAMYYLNTVWRDIVFEWGDEQVLYTEDGNSLFFEDGQKIHLE